MKMSVAHALVYKDYLMPLRRLENSFEECGVKIEFYATLSETGKKWIEIRYGCRPPQIISIEGDNPAQAVKDVAAAVKL